MANYLDKEVSDDYLQGLIAAYRNGYEAAGGTDVEDGDQPIIDDLAAHDVTTDPHANLLGRYDARQEQRAEVIAARATM